jgi:hypothetical protein
MVQCSKRTAAAMPWPSRPPGLRLAVGLPPSKEAAPFAAAEACGLKTHAGAPQEGWHCCANLTGG